MKDNVIAGAEQQGDDDKNYTISTKERYDEFVKQRNYPLQEGGFIDITGMTLEEVKRMNRE